MRVTPPEHSFNCSRFLGKRRPGPREDIQPVFGSDANVLATTVSNGTQGYPKNHPPPPPTQYHLP